MVSDCGCVSYENSKAVYNQFNSWLNKNNSSTNYTNPTYSYDPAMSFNGSVFDFDNSTFANTYGGLGMGALGSYMGGGYGMPYGGMWNNADSWWDYMDRYSDRSMSYNRHRIQQQREDERIINAPSDAIQGTLTFLQNTIQHDDQQNILPAYYKLCNAVSAMWPNLSEREVNTTANALYANYAQKPLYQDIRDNGKGMFMRKFWNGFTFGKWFNGSAEENIEELTGLPMSEEKRLYGKLGKGAGAATATAVAGTTVALILKKAPVIGRLMGKGLLGWTIAGVSLAVGAIMGFGLGNKKSE